MVLEFPCFVELLWHPDTRALRGANFGWVWKWEITLTQELVSGCLHLKVRQDNLRMKPTQAGESKAACFHPYFLIEVEILNSTTSMVLLSIRFIDWGWTDLTCDTLTPPILVKPGLIISLGQA
jgi:hypothetical protein